MQAVETVQAVLVAVLPLSLIEFLLDSYFGNNTEILGAFFQSLRFRSKDFQSSMGNRAR